MLDRAAALRTLSKAVCPIVVIAALSGFTPLDAAADDLQVVPASSTDVPPQLWLYADLQRRAHTALDRRRAQYEAVRTPDEAAEYQAGRREFFRRQLGELPERTPLNAKITGRIEADGYTIEKVLFESRPNHHVAALMYLPTTDPPYPCVIVASGHSRTGKAADYNQRFGIIMARHGMAALCYDPIGQGERSQILDADGHPKHGSTTTEHFQMGVGSILVGWNTATYRVWDGMRAIDYACSRDDVRADRIGFTGCSGGGTQTSYMMALDDRVAAAAPSCYLTTFRHLIDTIGPQDAEQNIFGQIAFGLDHPDYVLMRAPRPTLISSTTEDYFAIEGAWDNYRQAKRFYGRLGHPERVDLVEGDGGHGVPPTNLNAIMRWMRRWLLDVDDAPFETDIATHPLDALQCTPTGQVLDLPGEKSVFAFNAERGEALAQQRGEWQRATQVEDIRRQVRTLAAIRTPPELPRLQAERRGQIERDDYRIDKLLLRRDEGIPLPALLFVPRQAQSAAYLYLHGAGKQADASEDGPIAALARQGHLVLAIDLPGLGETRPEKSDGALGAWKEFYAAYLLGQSLVGIRAEATIQAGQWLTAVADNGDPAATTADTPTRRPVHLIASGEAIIPALHAAAASDRFNKVQLDAPELPSWTALLPQSETDNQLTGSVHGALGYYDLSDLARWHGGVEVTVGSR